MNLYTLVMFLLSIGVYKNISILKLLSLILSGLPLYFRLIHWLRMPCNKLSYFIQVTFTELGGPAGISYMKICAGLKRRELKYRQTYNIISTFFTGCTLNGLYDEIYIMDDEIELYYEYHKYNIFYNLNIVSINNSNKKVFLYTNQINWDLYILKTDSPYLRILLLELTTENHEKINQSHFYNGDKEFVYNSYSNYIIYKSKSFIIEHNKYSIENFEDKSIKYYKLVLTEKEINFLNNINIIELIKKPNLFYDGLAHRLNYIDRLNHLIGFEGIKIMKTETYSQLKSPKMSYNIIDQLFILLYLLIKIPIMILRSIVSILNIFFCSKYKYVNKYNNKNYYDDYFTFYYSIIINCIYIKNLSQTKEFLKIEKNYGKFWVMGQKN